MKRLKLGIVIVGTAILLVFTAIAYLAGVASASDGRTDTARGLLSQIKFSANRSLVKRTISYLKDMYFKEIGAEEEERLVYGAIEGMFKVLHEDEAFNDLYSNFYGPELYKELQSQTTGEYAGIGILMGLTNDGMYAVINQVFAGTPAEEAGVQPDDIIAEINGEDTYGMPLIQIASLVKGEPGTTVDLSFYRAGYDEYIELTIERRAVHVSSVPKEDAKLLDGNVGVIRITNFAQDTGKDFREHVEELLGQGMTSLVIDLRGNSGGLVDSAVHVAECFIKDGLVVKVVSREQDVQRMYANPEVKKYDFPVVILQNDNSASASEILAGALQDYKLAKIVGDVSFGKGVVQAIQPLEYFNGTTPDGDKRKLTKSALAITIGQYFTPLGRDIHGKGLEPDIWYNSQNQLQEDPVLRDYEKQIKDHLDEIKIIRSSMIQHYRENDAEIDRATEVAKLLAEGVDVPDVPKLEPMDDEHSLLLSGGQGEGMPAPDAPEGSE